MTAYAYIPIFSVVLLLILLVVMIIAKRRAQHARGER